MERFLQKVSLVIGVLLLICLGAVEQCYGLAYTISDLGTLGGSHSDGWGINNSGQVVGSSALPGDTAEHAFLYSGGVMMDLGTLGGSHSWGWGINNSGRVVGWSLIPGDTDWHAFLYSGGVMMDLGTLGGSISWGWGINNSGQVVGSSNLPGDADWHAFLYSGGVMTDLGTLGGSISWGWGINNSGQVVGSSNLPGDTDWRPFLYSGGVMMDLGTLGGSYSDGWGINSSGQVVGSSALPGDADWHAFLYSGGVMTDLNTLLPSGSGWILHDANAINDKGQIVGSGEINDEIHAFLMTPINNTPPKALCKDVTVPVQSGLCTANASVDGGSFDPDGDPIILMQSPAGPYLLGTTLVTLTVTDPSGALDSCSAMVTVVDKEAPIIGAVSASPNVLWPPNHKMVAVAVTANVTDNCSTAPVCRIVSVMSNEPVNGLGDGDTAPDWIISGDLLVQLRAERSGKGSGRIYTITVRCADASGNSSSTTTMVTVPNDQGNKE